MSNMAIKLVEPTSGKEEDNILMRDFTSVCRSSYSLFGKTEMCMPSHFENSYQKILDMEVRDDDVFCISFPKTGTTWCQEMIWLIKNDLNYEEAKTSLFLRFPFLEVEGVFEKNDSTAWLGDKVFNSVDSVASNSSRRFIKTHLPWQFLPNQIQNGQKSPKIVYVTRNPKDCLISYYYHCKLGEGYKGDFDNYFRLFLDGKVCFAPFWPHVLEYWKRRNNINILFLKYEDMKADLPSVIKKVAAFFDKNYTDEQVKKLSDHLSFDSMKNNQAVNYEGADEMRKKLGIYNGDGEFMRSGKVGDFKQHMSEEQIAKIDQWTEDAIKGTDFVPFKH